MRFRCRQTPSPRPGTDKHLVVWQPSTDRLWEFWRLEDTDARLAGEMGRRDRRTRRLTRAPTAPKRGPVPRPSWGARASSLSIAGGLITLEDLEKGEINHALAMAVPNTRDGVYASPAQRTDGMSTEPLSLPEGAHLRLDPNLNLASLHLPKLTLMMAEAAQRYGIFVRDTAANVAFYGAGSDPDRDRTVHRRARLLRRQIAQQILASFPWSDLQLLKMELHGTS